MWIAGTRKLRQQFVSLFLSPTSALGGAAAPIERRRFILLYGLLFAGFGVSSPFLPALLGAHGLPTQAIGVVLAAGTTTRLVVGPLVGRIADRLGRQRAMLAGCTAVAAVVALGYLPANGLLLLLVVAVASASALAPLVPLADALTLASTRHDGGSRFAYGSVRGAGSAAFVVGVVFAGIAMRRFQIDIVVWLNAALLGLAALVAGRVSDRLHAAAERPRHRDALVELLGAPMFLRLLLVAALVQGSHALHDSFAAIRWHEAGISPDVTGLLWAESVAAEVLVFVFVGGRLLDRLGVAGASMLAASAGIVRWGVMAQTSWLPAMALVQPLHGLTFALQHLACMRLLAAVVAPRFAATAQAIYGTVAIGATTAFLTLLSGYLYADFGSEGFWLMSALCAAALPVARRLRLPGG